MKRGTPRRKFTRVELRRIRRLLRTTDLPLSVIAIRFGRPPCSIIAVSKRLGARRNR
jgi:hypothetical protein